jgi:hypothetical protein
MSLNIALTSSSNMISFMLASDIVYSFLILLVSNSMEDSILSINGMKFRHIRFIKVFFGLALYYFEFLNSAIRKIMFKNCSNVKYRTCLTGRMNSLERSKLIWWGVSRGSNTHESFRSLIKFIWEMCTSPDSI